MAFEKVKNYFDEIGLGERVKDFAVSSATVELAAAAVGCEAKQIGKTLSFLVEDKPILIVVAGDRKIDNSKYKAQFHQKAKMIPANLVEEYIGHDIGGVCPFAIKPDVTVYLDESLKENPVVYPAAGSEHSAVELSIEELEHCSDYKEWIDVCKGCPEGVRNAACGKSL